MAKTRHVVALIASVLGVPVPLYYINIKLMNGIEIRKGQLPSKAVAQERKDEASKPFVAIVVCTRSLPKWNYMNETSLHTLLLPSLGQSVEDHERSLYRIEVVIGFDKGDDFWENSGNRNELMESADFPLNFIAIPKARAHHIPFNIVCRAAYEYGADYILRMNDDTEFVTKDWITMGVQRLNEYEPPNVGVVGPTFHQGNVAILTHDMVHRTHLDIFADYYPDEFNNWWIDDWISLVYGDARTTKLVNWTVRHHVEKHGTRYSVDMKQMSMLPATLTRGKTRIQEYLTNHTKDARAYTVLGTNRTSFLVGPIAAHANHSTVQK